MPLPLTFSQLSTALETQAVDGQENPIPTIYARKFYEVQGVLTMTRHMLQNNTIVINKASLAKLFASEAAFRCADRVVQVFGGRGYMREFPAERYLRELRVDRIWEGTSEIQRLVIARALEKRGVDKVVG